MQNVDSRKSTQKRAQSIWNIFLWTFLDVKQYYVAKQKCRSETLHCLFPWHLGNKQGSASNPKMLHVGFWNSFQGTWASRNGSAITHSILKTFTHLTWKQWMLKTTGKVGNLLQGNLVFWNVKHEAEQVSHFLKWEVPGRKNSKYKE